MDQSRDEFRDKYIIGDFQWLTLGIKARLNKICEPSFYHQIVAINAGLICWYESNYENH